MRACLERWVRETTMRGNKGFSLIELLIVVAIILILAAIAIPNLLRARIAANEASAVSSIRTIKTVEFSYYSAFPTIGYAAQLSDLGGPAPCAPPTSTKACLIDDKLATSGVGSTGKSGYVFRATGVSFAGPVNTAFVVGASPVGFNQSGTRNFCSTNDGVLRFDYGAPGSQPVNTLAACLAFPVAQ